MDISTRVIIAQLLITFITGGGLLGLLLYRTRVRNIDSSTELNKAKIEINLSQEAREILQVWKDNAVRAEQKAERAEKNEEILEGRIDFLIFHMRRSGMTIPDWPERLRVTYDYD